MHASGRRQSAPSGLSSSKDRHQSLAFARVRPKGSRQAAQSRPVQLMDIQVAVKPPSTRWWLPVTKVA